MNKTKISLGSLNLPDDLKKLNLTQCEFLCRDIRKTIIRTVMKNGGHLASNLGTVELTVALHRVFHSPQDKIVWDVGHQSYTHKLVTGRYDDFSSLRKENGISGFQRPSESVHDAFISGHSSTSISAALGMAEAMKLNNDNEHSAIAIIGDGAFTGGMAYEGLNNAGKSNSNIIVVLNHNDMSISKNVGAFAKYLTSIRGNQKYLDTKKIVENALNNTPVIGEALKRMLISSKSTLKLLLYHSTMFEDLGFTYLGPVDGHNISELEETFQMAKRINRPVFIHVNTVKGKGFRLAENNPGAFHSIPSSGYNYNNPDNSSYNTFSDYFGHEIDRLAHYDDNICAITAAMKYGTGLQYFAADFPSRFYDVGIAEQHAVTFAGGLAKSGKLPVLAVYSSFLQRSYDQLIHDIAIDRLHVVLAVDRAGIVGEDGETHQGIFDIPMLVSIPETTIFSPSNISELALCINAALYKTEGLAAVRYPKGKESRHDYDVCPDTVDYCINKRSENANGCLAVSFGKELYNVYEAVENNNLDCDILKLVKIFPVSDEVVDLCGKYKKIVIFEESSKSGGIGEHLVLRLCERGFNPQIKVVAISGFVQQASMESSACRFGLDSISVAQTIADMCKTNH